MKKILVAAILGIAAVSAMAQSRIQLDSATAPIPYPYISYGAGVSGHTAGTFVAASANYTVGVFYSTSAATFTDVEGGTGTPGGTFLLGTGAGSTATMSAFDGLFFQAADFTIPGTVNTAWLVIVAYNGADYASSTVRGHSAVFTVAPNTTVNGGGTSIAAAMSGAGGFQVFTVVPEPSTFALAGLGLASLLIFRRRK